jgi:hypothetical protein
MTTAQQKHIDSFHERVITLIYARRKALRYNSSGQADWDAITAEIEKVEDERRAYIKSLGGSHEGEKLSGASQQEESKIERGISGSPAGTELEATEAGLQS